MEEVYEVGDIVVEYWKWHYHKGFRELFVGIRNRFTFVLAIPVFAFVAFIWLIFPLLVLGILVAGASIIIRTGI